METEEKQLDEKVGRMHKRRETMPDGQRYIIFYTFGNGEGETPPPPPSEVNENV